MRKLIIMALLVAGTAGLMIGCEPVPVYTPPPDVYLGKIVDVKMENIQVSGIGEYRMLITYTLDNGSTATETKHEPPRGLVIGGYLYQDRWGNLIIKQTAPSETEIKPTPDAMKDAGKHESK